MNPLVTVFTATLVQDSAISVSGLDRESTADRPLTVDVDGRPILSGRGLKGAAVSMAGRFFDPLPRSVADFEGLRKGKALIRSAWEFTNARPTGEVTARLRAGVGIVQKTGARKQGVLTTVKLCRQEHVGLSCCVWIGIMLGWQEKRPKVSSGTCFQSTG